MNWTFVVGVYAIGIHAALVVLATSYTRLDRSVRALTSEVLRMRRTPRRPFVPVDPLTRTVPGRYADWSDDDLATRIR